MTAHPLGSSGPTSTGGPLAAVMSLLAAPAPVSAGCGSQDSPVAGFAAMVAAAMAASGGASATVPAASTAADDVVDQAAGETAGGIVAATGAQPTDEAAVEDQAPVEETSQAAIAAIAPVIMQRPDLLHASAPAAVVVRPLDAAAAAQPMAGGLVAAKGAAVTSIAVADGGTAAAGSGAAPADLVAESNQMGDRDAAAQVPQPRLASPAEPLAAGARPVQDGAHGRPETDGLVSARREHAGASAGPAGAAGPGLAQAASLAPEHAAVHALAAAASTGGEVQTDSPSALQPGVAASTGVSPSSAADASGAEPRVVAAQVLPEVAELSRRGPGVHRVILQLHPETLGEVKVVLTMRGGEVHVSLAAGQEARGALRETLPELQRLLEGNGVRDAQVALRDLSSSTSAASGSHAGQHSGHAAAQGHGFGQQLGTQLSDQASAFAEQSGAHDRAPGQQDGRAGTRGDGRTTEGTLEGLLVSPVAPVAHAVRDAGVDLVM